MPQESAVFKMLQSLASPGRMSSISLLVGCLLLALISSSYGQGFVYIQAGNDSLPVWNGTCSTVFLGPLGPCEDPAAPCTLPTGVFNVDSSCGGMALLSGSVLSNVSIYPSVAFSALTFDNTTQMGAHDVLFTNSLLSSNFFLTLNNTGLFQVVINDYGFGGVYNYYSGPGMVLMPATANAQVLSSNWTSFSPSKAYFPVGFTSPLGIANAFLTGVNTSLVTNANAPASPGTSVNWGSLTTSDCYLRFAGSWTGGSSTFSNTSLIGVTFQGVDAIFSSLSTTYVKAKLSGKLQSITSNYDSVALPGGSTFITVANTAVISLSVSSLTPSIVSGGSGTTWELISNCDFSQLSLMNLYGSTMLTWGFYNLQPNAMAYLSNFNFYTSVTFNDAYGSAMTVMSNVGLLCTSTTGYCLWFAGPVVNTTTFAPSSMTIATATPCSIRWTGRISLASDLVVDSMCTPGVGNATLTGTGAIEVTKLIGSGDTITFNNSLVKFHALTSIGAPALSFPGNNLTFVASSPNAGMVSNSAWTATNVVIDWPYDYSFQPALNTPYALLSSPGATSVIQSISSPNRNVTLSASTTTYTYTFGAVPCNSSCVSAHMSSTNCASTAACSCIAPWSGPLCDCNTTGMATGASLMCSPNGGQVWVFNDTTLAPYAIYTAPQTTITVPTNTILSVPIGVTFTAPVIVQNDALVVYQGIYAIQMYFNEGFTIYSTLYESRVGGECTVQGTPAILAPTGVFNTSNMNFVLDVSALSRDSSCTGVANLDAALVQFSYSIVTAFQSPPNVNIQLVDHSGQDGNLLNFTVVLNAETYNATIQYGSLALPSGVSLCFQGNTETNSTDPVLRYAQSVSFQYCPPPPAPPPVPVPVPVATPLPGPSSASNPTAPSTPGSSTPSAGPTSPSADPTAPGVAPVSGPADGPVAGPGSGVPTSTPSAASANILSASLALATLVSLVLML